MQFPVNHLPYIPEAAQSRQHKTQQVTSKQEILEETHQKQFLVNFVAIAVSGSP